jgi:pyruvate/2-oxoglutarate dehydrogenase complex dihydrolipoamide acyltransferase (E2) component
LIVEDQAAYARFLALDLGSIGAIPVAGLAATDAVPAAALSSQSTPIQRFSPAARHRIASAGLSPAQLVGTAKHGVITKGDVVKAQLAGTLSAAAAPSLSLPVSPPPSPLSPSAPSTLAAAESRPAIVPAAASPNGYD